jgi:hypothetical protein
MTLAARLIETGPVVEGGSQRLALLLHNNIVQLLQTYLGMLL